MITVEHIKSCTESVFCSDFAGLHQNGARSYAGLRVLTIKKIAVSGLKFYRFKLF